jgi:uncharacterized protein (TIGR03435 family)
MDSHRAPRHVLVLCFGAIACSASTAHAQAPGAPAFEVSSIKENQSASDNASVRALPGGRVSVTNNSLRNIIRNAYNVQNDQIIGGPDWINTVRWDITAKAADDAPPQQLLLMLRTLLADRFKLVVRRDTREMPVFALILGRPDGGSARSSVRRTSTARHCSLPQKPGERRHRRRPMGVPHVGRVRRGAA